MECVRGDPNIEKHPIATTIAPFVLAIISTLYSCCKTNTSHAPPIHA